MFNMNDWSGDVADSAVEGMEEGSFDSFALKIIIQGLLVWLAWRFIGFIVGNIAYAYGTAFHWVVTTAIHLVQVVLHFIGGR